MSRDELDADRAAMILEVIEGGGAGGIPYTIVKDGLYYRVDVTNFPEPVTMYRMPYYAAYRIVNLTTGVTEGMYIQLPEALAAHYQMEKLLAMAPWEQMENSMQDIFKAIGIDDNGPEDEDDGTVH